MSSLFDSVGQRKYLSPSERSRFLRAAAAYSLKTQVLCEFMVDTGCRVSEALSLIPSRIDLATGAVVFECLKKRTRGIFRSVPISPHLRGALAGLIEAKAIGPDERLWSWSRMTAFRKLKAIMAAAGITGAHAMPKGLRHGFAVAAVDKGVPLNMVQRWMGHASLATTSIYADAIGEEERRLVRRLWRA